MNKFTIILLLTIAMLSCKNETENVELQFLTTAIPGNLPIEFESHPIPQNKLIHKGIFSPDLKEYYYTLSDKNYTHFEVYVVEKSNGNWSAPEKAFFNSSYNEHGMSFSPNGNTLYFSSTRPVEMEEVQSTWHIWKSYFLHRKS